MLLNRSVFSAMAILVAASFTTLAPVHADTAAKAKPAANPIVVMQLAHYGTAMGTVLIKLFPENAPLSCANFEKLINAKFYNGLTFHRVENLGSMDNSSPGRIAQGGDPAGNGSGGPGWTIKGEFAQNGVNNPLKHNAGAVAMARAQDPNSAGSQFYICINPVHDLDGGYAVFGQVISGMDVASKIQVGDKMTSVTLKK